MSDVRLAMVVPTYNRPDDLRKLLDSIRGQSRSLDQLIIVDGSDDPIDGVVADFPDLSVDYVRVRPPSLAAQRNAGMATLRDDITHAGYLDDDIVLEPDAVERMTAFLESAGADVGGAAFSIINQPEGGRGLGLKKLLGLQGKVGSVTQTGHATHIPYVTETVETDWLYGGATVWKREVIDEFAYDEWYVGHGYLEDVDYSYRVSRKYRLFVLGDARLWHFSRPMTAESQIKFGRQLIYNRVYLARKMGFPPLLIAWGVMLQMLANFALCIVQPGRLTFRRFLGTWGGLWAVLSGQSKPIGAILK